MEDPWCSLQGLCGPANPVALDSMWTWPLGDSQEACPYLEEGWPGLETTLPGQEPRSEADPPPGWVRRQGACLCLTFMARQHFLLAFLMKWSHRYFESSECLAVNGSRMLQWKRPHVAQPLGD